MSLLNPDDNDPIFGFGRDRFHCIKEGCGEEAHAWAVVQLGGLDPQAAMICAIHIHFFCMKHWEDREVGLMGVRADLFPIDPTDPDPDKRPI